MSCATLAWIVGIHAFTTVFCSVVGLVVCFPGFGKEGEGEGKERAANKQDTHRLSHTFYFFNGSGTGEEPGRHISILAWADCNFFHF